MPSAWVRTRQTKAGQPRYRVEYRLGGRATPVRYGGSFKRKAEADDRKRWIMGELAARRLPHLRTILRATAMTLDYAGRHRDNPARDKRFVKLPHEQEEEINPPLAEHVLAAFKLMPFRYRLPLLVLDDTGMRISELEKLEWRD